jgi:ribosomal protein L37E
MTLHACPVHHIAMEPVPAQPRTRCTHCGYMTHHVQFGRCRECGNGMVIEEPEPRWHCPKCAPGHVPQANP